jgi:hypothetical protein
MSTEPSWPSKPGSRAVDDKLSLLADGLRFRCSRLRNNRSRDKPLVFYRDRRRDIIIRSNIRYLATTVL